MFKSISRCIYSQVNQVCIYSIIEVNYMATALQRCGMCNESVLGYLECDLFHYGVSGESVFCPLCLVAMYIDWQKEVPDHLMRFYSVGAARWSDWQAQWAGPGMCPYPTCNSPLDVERQDTLCRPCRIRCIVECGGWQPHEGPAMLAMLTQFGVLQDWVRMTLGQIPTYKSN